MSRFRPFCVALPSGVRYWTVLDGGLRPVVEVDDFLLHQRLGRDRAESTTEAYARSIALFLEWHAQLGLPLERAGGHLGRFIFWLQHYREGQVEPLTFGAVPVRGPRRVNSVLAAVREWLRHSVAVGTLDPSALAALYDIVDDIDLPVEVRGERPSRLRARVRHRLVEPRATVDGVTDEEMLALLRVCTNARDRFILMVLWRAGVRRGELLGLRREDVHFVPNASRLGCGVRGPHLHVIRRNNVNKASAKSRRDRAIPVDWLTVQAHDLYLLERGACTAADNCDFLLVNLLRGVIGSPMRPQAANELLEVLSVRAGLRRRVHPHMLRHGFGTNVGETGATLDVIAELLGHASLTSSEVYLHPSQERLRDAVARVPSPRTPRRWDEKS